MAAYDERLPFVNPWKLPERCDGGRVRYICITGNTAAGKSTLLRAVAKAICVSRPNTIGIDEQAIHHPYLRHLFYEPARFAYEMQINFMLQRVVVAGTWLNAGFNVIMERSHLDDPVFIRHLRRSGLVTASEHDAYMTLWQHLRDRLQLPDMLLYLEVDPATSVNRLTDAENRGIRPREFPDEESKRAWVSAWGELYEQRIRELERDQQHVGRVHRVAGHSPEEVLDLVEQIL